MDTSRINKVKPPQHDGTPRAHGGLAEVVLRRVVDGARASRLFFLQSEEIPSGQRRTFALGEAREVTGVRRARQ